MSPVSVPAIHRAVREALEGRLRRHTVIAIGIAVAAALLLSWIAGSSEGWTGARWIPLVLDLALVASVTAILWRARRGREALLSEAGISASMEQASGLASGQVQGALELSRGLPEGVSPSLAGKAQQWALAQLDLPTERLEGPVGEELAIRTKKAFKVLGVLAPVLVLLAIVTPGRALHSWGGLLRPVSVLSGPELPALVAETGDFGVLRGTAASVSFTAPLRTELTIYWQAAGDVARSETIPVVDGRAVHTFPEISAETRYRAEAPDGAETGEFTVRPIDPLFVTDVTVRLEFPSYLERSTEEYRGDLPPFLVPAGTRFAIEGRASRSLSTAALVRDDGSDGRVDIGVDGSAFETVWVPREDGIWTWDFLDGDGGVAASVPQPIVLTVVPDTPPSIRIAFPVPDTILPLDLRQPLILEAEDDHGLSQMELVAWRVDALGEAYPSISQSLGLGGTPAAMARPLLDVSTWGLVPGDQVRYYARVVDSHPSGQEARTAEYVLRMPAPEEMRRDAQMRLEDAARRLDELQNLADEAAEETRNLERQAQAPNREEPSGQRAEDQATFQEREEVRSAIEDQLELIEQADSLNAEIEALAEALEEAGAADPEFDEDLEELQELLEELGGEELQERMDDLLSQVDQMDQDDAAQTLEDLAAEQEEFQQRLEEALARAQRAAVEQEFRNAAQETEELAEEQLALAEAMREGSNPELRAQQQESLREEAAEMAQRMEELSEELMELGEMPAYQGVQEAQNSTEQAVQQMQQAAQAGQSAEPQAQQEASQAAEQAAQEMLDAADEMRQAQEQMMQERAEAYEAALQQTSQDALALAREQGQVQENMRGSTPDEMADLRGDVAAVRQGVENLARNLDLAARLAGADQRETSEQMGTAMQALDEALEALDSGSSSRPSPFAASEQSIDALNEVAMSAIAAARALQQGGESQSSSEEMMEQMEDLAQQQADLNNQASQMLPMQLTEEQQQQQMQEMAQQQQQIASDLGQMSDQEGEEGPLGDIEAMAEEAAAIAEELEGGRLEPETRRRQERLFHRLLDAGRSLQKEEESTQRESEVPGAFERGDIGALTGDDLGLLRFPMPSAADLNRLPPAARALVLRYFQRLNAGGGGATTPGSTGAGNGGG